MQAQEPELNFQQLNRDVNLADLAMNWLRAQHARIGPFDPGDGLYFNP